MDLSTLDTVAACNKGAEVELLHPVSRAPLGVFVTVLGSDSDTFKELLRSRVDERIRREALARKRGRELETPTVAQREAESIETLCACTTGWRTGDEPTLTLHGEALPFSIPNAKRVYTDLLWVRKQVDEAVADLENFMPG